jgi:transposase-like protein
VSYVQASQDLNVHPSQLRDWVKKFSEDPQHAFPGHGQLKPEQLEIAQLKREVAKLKAERDMSSPISNDVRRRSDTFSSQPRSREYRWLFLRKAAAYFAKEST